VLCDLIDSEGWKGGGWVDEAIRPRRKGRVYIEEPPDWLAPVVGVRGWKEFVRLNDGDKAAEISPQSFNQIANYIEHNYLQEVA
jgi:hypothetical protein